MISTKPNISCKICSLYQQKFRCTSSLGPLGFLVTNYTHLFGGKPWAPHMLVFDVPNFVLLGLRKKKSVKWSSSSLRKHMKGGNRTTELVTFISWDLVYLPQTYILVDFYGTCTYSIHGSNGNDPEPEN